jgi:phage minor structural protein
MKPILYDSQERIFSDNGIGVLNDAGSCVVEEERNGGFELAMTYPVTGIHYGSLSDRGIILAKPNPNKKPQPFRIYRITKPLNGFVTVYAQHISYDLSGVAIPPFSASGLSEVFQKMQSTSIPSNAGFIYRTDKTSTANLKCITPISARSLLGGVRGSVLDVYGGEYEFDRFIVKLWKNRGSDKGVTIRYGKNLTSLEQDHNCAAVYTKVYPYWTNGESVVQLPEKVIDVTGAFDFVRVLSLDLSSNFDEAPTEDQLRTAARYYITDNKVGVPKVSLEVSFDQLDEPVNLCDEVTVVFVKLGVSTKAKVVRTTYDVLLDRYTSVEIGDIRTSIADTIAGQTTEIQSMPTSSDMQKAIMNATAWITGGGGGYVIFKRNDEGQPTEILIMDTPELTTTTKIWRWNSGGLGFSSNGGQTYETAITQDGSIVGKFISADTLYVNGANITGTIKAGAVIAESIKAGSVTTDCLAGGAVTSSKIYDGSVTNDKIGSYAVDGGNIATDAIVNRHLTSGSVQQSTCSTTLQNLIAEGITAKSILTGTGSANDLTADYFKVTTSFRFKSFSNPLTLYNSNSLPTYVLGTN